jgi:hypothetical protein
MILEIYKDRRNTGKFFRKTPSDIQCKITRKIASKDISKYIEVNDDFGNRNYLGVESSVLRLSNKYNIDCIYTYEDLY